MNTILKIKKYLNQSDLDWQESKYQIEEITYSITVSFILSSDLFTLCNFCKKNKLRFYCTVEDSEISINFKNI